MAAGLLNFTPPSDTHKRPFFNQEGLSTMNHNHQKQTARAHVPGPLDEKAEWDRKAYDSNTKPH